MKNLFIAGLLLFCSAQTFSAQADISSQNTLKDRIEQWAAQHPDLYSAAYFSSIGFLSIGAGALYARLFKPELLTKAFEDSTAGVKEFLCDPHVIGALATFVGTGIGSYFAPIFLNDIRAGLSGASLSKGQIAAISLLYLTSRLLTSSPSA